MAEMNAIAAPVNNAGMKECVACAIAPVKIGASAPPRKPPKFCTAPNEATRLGGAATVANAQEQALAAFAKKATTEMQASATTLLVTSAAGTVNSAMPTMATIVICSLFVQRFTWRRILHLLRSATGLLLQ